MTPGKAAVAPIGHGVVVCSSTTLKKKETLETSDGVSMTAEEAREVIGTRFLADPSFKVSIDGTLIAFDDIPTPRLQEMDVEAPPFGKVHLTMIDTLRADRTTRQHGIAWRVNSRLVGNPGWVGFNDERILDGRTTEAKRFQFIIEADILVDSVLPDWSAFIPDNEAWNAVRTAVHATIKQLLSTFTAERRRIAKTTVKDQLGPIVTKLSPVGRDRSVQLLANGYFL